MRLHVAVALLVMAWAALPARSQSTAQIHGTIQDAFGAAVPGAEVKTTQTDTGFSRIVVSGADGSYVLTNLPIGPYRMEVSKEGFARAIQSGVALQVNSDPLVDVALRLGQVNEQINVEASAAMVETLTVPERSPPVPHVSIAPSGTSTRVP